MTRHGFRNADEALAVVRTTAADYQGKMELVNTKFRVLLEAAVCLADEIEELSYHIDGLHKMVIRKKKGGT